MNINPNNQYGNDYEESNMYYCFCRPLYSSALFYQRYESTKQFDVLQSLAKWVSLITMNLRINYLSWYVHSFMKWIIKNLGTILPIGYKFCIRYLYIYFVYYILNMFCIFSADSSRSLENQKSRNYPVRTVHPTVSFSP